MIKFSVRFLTFSLLIFLCGCSMFQHIPAKQDISWEKRSTAVNRIQSWDIQGVVSIQHANKTDLASLQWQQQIDHYQFSLFGPLGFGRIEVIGKPGIITLRQSNKPAVTAATPELLMQNQLGWNIPVSHLYYWARGLPAPGIAAKKTFDAYHHLTQLQQEGWNITYVEYMPVNQVDLPRKIELSTDQLKIKLVVRKWDIEGDMDF